MSTIIVLRNTLFYGFANALQKLFGFFLLFVAALFLTPEEYGHLALISLFSGLAHMSISSTIHGAILRFYIDLEGDKRKRFIGSTLIFILSFSLLFILILFLAGQNLVGLLFPRSNISFYPLFALSLGTLFFILPQEIANSIFKIKETPKFLLSLLYASVTLTTALTLVLLVVFRQGLRGLLLGQFLASTLVFWLCLYMIRNEFVFRFSWRLFKPALLFSLPLLPYIFMDFLRNRSAIYFLEKSVEIKEVGLYYFGLSVGMIMNAITSAFATSYSPRMFNLFREQPLELAKREYAKIFQYIFLLMNIACVVIGLFSEEFVLLFMPKYVRSYTIIPLITFSYFLGGVYLFFHNSFYWVKKTSLVSLSSFGMCVITIFAQVLLIPRHGIVGSAFGLFIGQVAGLMIGYLLSQKAFPMNYHFKAIILVSIISMISVFLISLWTPTEFSIWRFGLKLSALCTVFLMTIKKFKVTAKSVWPQVKAILKLLKSA